MATGPDGEQITDVNGIGVNFTLVNAVEVAIGDNADDQGEQTDPSLDLAVSNDTNTAAGDASGAQPTLPLARANAQQGGGDAIVPNAYHGLYADNGYSTGALP
eukprot:4710168-Pleurochrysis_carterae.AAC.1